MLRIRYLDDGWWFSTVRVRYGHVPSATASMFLCLLWHCVLFSYWSCKMAKLSKKQQAGKWVHETLGLLWIISNLIKAILAAVTVPGIILGCSFTWSLVISWCAFFAFISQWRVNCKDLTTPLAAQLLNTCQTNLLLSKGWQRQYLVDDDTIPHSQKYSVQ